MRRPFEVALILLAFFAGTMPTHAQEIYATLIGTVTDSTGAVLAGASVTVHNNDTNTDFRTVTTNGTGNYTVTNLPPGNYTVTVKNLGFRSYSAANLVVHVAEKRTLDVQLQPGQVTETVNVTESAIAVQTANAAQMVQLRAHKFANSS